MGGWDLSKRLKNSKQVWVLRCGLERIRCVTLGSRVVRRGVIWGELKPVKIRVLEILSAIFWWGLEEGMEEVVKWRSL